MTQGKHFAAGGDHFAALPSKKIHAPKGIARLTVTAATMAAMTGSSLISPFTAFAQTGDGGTQHPAVMSPIAAHAGAASGTGAKSVAQTIADLQKAVDEAKAKEDAAKASYDEAAGPYNEAASARDQAKASYDSAVSAGTAADRAAMDEYARQVAEGKDAADAAGKGVVFFCRKSPYSPYGSPPASRQAIDNIPISGMRVIIAACNYMHHPWSSIMVRLCPLRMAFF